VDPENRLVARGLETEWETALGQLADAGAELARREQARPKALTAAERAAILSLGDNLEQVWTAPTTTDKDRKQLLRTLLEEVTVNVHRDDTEGRADLLLRWKGGAISELAVPIRRQPPCRRRSGFRWREALASLGMPMRGGGRRAGGVFVGGGTVPMRVAGLGCAGVRGPERGCAWLPEMTVQ
jgi:hypothetical protein